jgi:hypothetical protein
VNIDAQLFWFRDNQSLLLFLSSVLNGEATNTNFVVFGFTRPGLEPPIYRSRGEHANHYTNDEVHI